MLMLTGDYFIDWRNCWP